MSNLFEQTRSVYTEISENQIGRLTPGLSAADFISAYKEKVKICHSLHEKLAGLLAGHLYPLLDNITCISDEEENELFLTAQNLSSYDQRLDSGLALNIYQRLLERARHKGGDDDIIKYLYWCGITMFFLLFSRKDPKINEQTAAYFDEAAGYAARYDTYKNPETRKYIHRCLGNRSLLYYYVRSPQEAILAEEENFAFWNNIIYSGKDNDFPWTGYFMNCLTHRHNEYLRQIYAHIGNPSKEECDKLLEISLTINRLYHKNSTLYDAFGGTRYDFILWRAQFFSGLISFDLLRENALKRMAQFDDDDYSADAIYAKIQTNFYLISFAANMPHLANRKESLLAEMLGDVLGRLSGLPMSLSPVIVRELLQSFTSEIAPILSFSEQLDIIFKLTANRHIQTYAHSAMVSRLSEFLARTVINSSPKLFVGLFQAKSVSSVKEKSEEILDFARTAGLCHDIGLLPYASDPFLSARAAFDDEYFVIENHTRDGAALLGKNTSHIAKSYIDVILGHHKHFDNIGGHPAEYDRNSSKVQIMVDIVTIANAIDLATDNISKLPSLAKNIPEYCKSVISKSGKVFSPVIAALLEDEAVVAEIVNILESEREKAYYEAYLIAWDSPGKSENH